MMNKIFNKNMFIMAIVIMIGAVTITYFIADLQHQSQLTQIATDHSVEIDTIEENNLNFTNGFLESSVLLDTAREDRAYGNYHFDIAYLFYSTALSEKNISLFGQYRNQTIDNCSQAMPQYMVSHQNFQLASTFFYNTRNYTSNQQYLVLLEKYVNLTASGAELTLLRYNASHYLLMLAENMTFVNDTVILENMTDIEELFNMTMEMYKVALIEYVEIQDEIEEYNIKGFSTIREPH